MDTENFGVRQSRVYRDTIVQAIGELADGPDVAGSKGSRRDHARVFVRSTSRDTIVADVTSLCAGLAGTFLRNLHNSWQPDRESRATAGLALDRDIPTHHLTETLTDREPKARATILAGYCGRNLGELLE
jgi:hypothetical protein